MVVNFSEVKEVVDMLPIGLYSRRRVPVTLEKETVNNTSYYNLMEDKIIISYGIIAKGLANVPDNETEYTKETAIRSMVYHELSHAILTPQGASIRNDFSILNIVEDERIETILKDFYLDVNFKKNILMICGGTIQQPQTVDQAFFNLVRFRVCKDKTFIDRVEKLIAEYSDINATYTCKRWDNHIDNSYIAMNKSYRVCFYCNDIDKLYDDFCKAYSSDSSMSNFSDEELEEMTSNIKNENGSGSGATENREGQGEREKSNSSENNENADNNSSENGKNANDNGENSNGRNANDNEDINIQNEGFGRGNDNSSIFDNVLSSLRDNSLTNTLETIISQFNKKNKGGSGITSYSGVFNPRLVGNDNYRYFERSMSCNGNNRFGKFHLNLYIDNSGSFENNAPKVNTLINSLKDIEQRNKNFTFDVILCGDELTETNKNNRWVFANEGTYARYEPTKAIFKKHNTKNGALVKNILMYDGEVGFDRNIFPIFDTSNSTIIVERDNVRKVQNLKSAKVIKILNGTYTEKFIEETVKAIENAFR